MKTKNPPMIASAVASPRGRNRDRKSTIGRRTAVNTKAMNTAMNTSCTFDVA